MGICPSGLYQCGMPGSLPETVIQQSFCFGTHETIGNATWEALEEYAYASPVVSVIQTASLHSIFEVLSLQLRW